MSEAEFLHHEPCPECPSTDAFARYSDGHGYCFACEHYEPGEGDSPGRTKRKKPVDFNPIEGEIKELRKRKIDEETCRKFGYRVGKYRGRNVQIADYRTPDGSQLAAQKVRYPDKEMWVNGSMKEAGLFGQHLWGQGGKMVVVTEGEIDALTVSQLQSNKWPVVSVPNGAQGARKAVQKNLEWLESFGAVIFMFDSDEPGQEAAEECAAVLTPGKAKIAHLPLKDPNDMLKQGKGGEVISAMWNATPYRPDGLVSIDDIMSEVTQPVEWGKPWCFDKLTQLTYGRRPGEVYAIGAGTGIGKTDFMTQQAAYDVLELGESVGMVYLEAKPTDTAKRVAGKVAGKQFHIPDGEWTEAELLEALDSLEGKVTFYDSFGETEWDIVKGKLRYMAHQGIQHVYVDHLTAMADTADEKASLEQTMKEMSGLANELDLIVHFVSHLATPEGKPHEEGGRVMIRHFKGSRAIGFWSHFMFGLERNQQADDPGERQTTTFRCLKDRYTGQSTGQTFPLGYEHGLLVEKTHKEDSPFDNEEEEEDDLLF